MKRHCTQCGHVTNKESESLFLCPSGHENWINPAAGAVAFIVHEGSVIYGVRSADPGRGKLCAPGGFIEVGETAEQAAIRECQEELGLDITILGCLGTYASMYEGRHVLDIVFVASCTTTAATPGDDMAGGDPVWRPLTNLPSADELWDDWYLPAQADLIAWVAVHESTGLKS